MAGTYDTSIRSYDLYMEGTTPSTNVFSGLNIPFVSQNTLVENVPFLSQGMIIANDNASMGANIQISFDGTTIHGTIQPQEMLTFDFRHETQIFLRSSAASAFRFWTW
jgi:hypothetical protein